MQHPANIKGLSANDCSWKPTFFSSLTHLWLNSRRPVFTRVPGLRAPEGPRAMAADWCGRQNSSTFSRPSFFSTVCGAVFFMLVMMFQRFVKALSVIESLSSRN